MGQQVDAVMAATAAKATYSGSATIIGGWWMSSEFAILVGMVVGVAGLLVQWYYRHKLTKAEIALRRDQNDRERAEHDLRMAELRASAHPRNRGGA